MNRMRIDVADGNRETRANLPLNAELSLLRVRALVISLVAEHYT